MILHIPHSSHILPNDKIVEEHLSVFELTDWRTDDLFQSVGSERLVFPYTRLFCDVERLVNDPLESSGQGIMYRKGYDGEIINMKKYGFSDEERMQHYHDHHNKLEALVMNQLSYNGKCVLVDCHSYSDRQARATNTPDICIGSNLTTSKKLIELVAYEFLSKRYTVGLNVPYGNSILPNNKNIDGLESIMIEVHKRTYVDVDLLEDTPQYDVVKNDISEVLDLIKDYEFS
jgi:N-formylglutamate amidohydrolase